MLGHAGRQALQPPVLDHRLIGQGHFALDVAAQGPGPEIDVLVLVELHRRIEGQGLLQDVLAGPVGDLDLVDGVRRRIETIDELGADAQFHEGLPTGKGNRIPTPWDCGRSVSMARLGQRRDTVRHRTLLTRNRQAPPVCYLVGRMNLPTSETRRNVPEPPRFSGARARPTAAWPPPPPSATRPAVIASRSMSPRPSSRTASCWCSISRPRPS